MTARVVPSNKETSVAEAVLKGGMEATVTVLVVFGLVETGENLGLLVWKAVGANRDDVYAILVVVSPAGEEGDRLGD